MELLTQGVKAGSVDIGLAATSNLAPLHGRVRPFDLPFLFKSERVYTRDLRVVLEGARGLGEGGPQSELGIHPVERRHAFEDFAHPQSQGFRCEGLLEERAGRRDGARPACRGSIVRT